MSGWGYQGRGKCYILPDMVLGCVVQCVVANTEILATIHFCRFMSLTD